ncbi:MAG: fibrobacter succinogenes major paralogous domain-containing protein [Mediterranea sp.]|nr:fibrobacter succinogenes major paralogous domain-containing protein [Mediterranea sp.]
MRSVLLLLCVFCFVCSYGNNGLMVQPSSNCYIVAPNSAPIAIPVSRANEFDASAIGDATVFGAELIWSDVNAGNDTGLGGDGCIAGLDISGSGNSGYIIVYPGRREGNAVVAVTVGTGADRIKWSWHIWVTSYDPTSNPRVYTNTDSVTYTLMDRNLGAIHAGGSNLRWGTPESLGLHYQWGRKDPFPVSASVTDNTEKAIYTAGGATTVDANKTDNGGGGISIATTVRNPLVFYYLYTNSYADWCSVTTDSDTRWGNSPYVKSLYDPCPAGWRVPNEHVWVGHTTDNFAYTDTPAGRYHEQTGWYPASGYRGNYDGKVSGLGIEGYYWSATPTNNYSYILFFNSDHAYSNGSFNRAYGFSVRCVAEK